MQMIETHGLSHKVKRGDMYRLRIINNHNEELERLFFIKSITDKYIDFDYFFEEQNKIYETEYNQLKKTNRREIHNKGISGIMIKNELKINFTHSTKDCIMFSLG